MYNIDNTFNTAIKQPSRDFLSTYMNINGSRTTVYDIQKFTIESSCGSSDKLVFGNADAAKINVSIIISENTPAIWAGKVEPVAVMSYDSTTCNLSDSPDTRTEVPLGTFYIDKPSVKITDLQVTFDAYDMMYSLDDAIWDMGELNNTDDILKALKQNGIPIADNIPERLEWKKTLTGMSIREVIKELALLFGSNAVFDRNGNLTFVQPLAIDFPIDANNYIKFEKQENGLSKLTGLTTTVTKTVIKTETDEDGEITETEEEVSETFTVGDDTGTVLELSSSNITTQSELNSLYVRANMPIQYQSYELETQGFPHVDCGDVITLTAKDNIAYSLPIVSHTLEFSGGFHSIFRAATLGCNEKKKPQGLRAAVQALQNNIGGIKQEITTAAGDAAQALLAANGANTTANNSLLQALKAQQNLDNLQIGGKNLLTSTKDFSGFNWKNKNNSTENGTYLGLSVRRCNTTWNGIFQEYQAVKGETYTFSAYIKTEGTHDVWIVRRGANGTAVVPSGQNNVGHPTEWTRVSYTFTALDDGLFGLAIERTNDKGTVDFCGYKLERGNKDTDWSPATEDMQNQIDNVIAQLSDIANDNKLTPNEKVYTSKEWEQIKSEYDKIKNEAITFSVSYSEYETVYNALSTYIGTLDLSSSATTDIVQSDFAATFKDYYDVRTDMINLIASAKAKQEVNNLEIGGTNLFVLSDCVDAYVDGTYPYDTVPYDYSNHKVMKTKIAINQCETLIYQLWNPNKVNSTAYNRIVWYDSDNNPLSIETLPQLDGSTYQCEKYTAPENTYYVLLSAIIGEPYYDDSIKVKFEKGNKATGYSQAPEDIQNKIDDVNVSVGKAQASADSKNTVYYLDGKNDSAGIPTVVPVGTSETPLKVNDLWFNTGEDNCSYRWNGTAWERKAYGNGAIDTLDAGKITVNDLSAFNATIGGMQITNNSIYCGTNSMESDVEGIYLGKDGFRQYLDSTHFANIENGVLTAYGAVLRGAELVDSPITFTDGSDEEIGKIYYSVDGALPQMNFDSYKLSIYANRGVYVKTGINGFNVDGETYSTYITATDALYSNGETFFTGITHHNENANFANNRYLRFTNTDGEVTFQVGLSNANNAHLFSQNGYSGKLTIGNSENSGTIINGKGGTNLTLTEDSAGKQVYSKSIYDRTYSSGPTVTVTSYGTLGRISSASKYKLNIQPIQEDSLYAYNILKLVPKQWFDKNSCELASKALEENLSIDDIERGCGVESIYGLIAEDVEKAGLGKYCIYNADGELEGIQYERLWTLLIPIVAELYKKVTGKEI